MKKCNCTYCLYKEMFENLEPKNNEKNVTVRVTDLKRLKNLIDKLLGVPLADRR